PTRPRLLVLSPAEPDWSRAFADFPDVLAEPPRYKRFEPVLSAGQVVRFLLRANPSVKKQGHRHGLYNEQAQLQWLARKGEAGGFAPLKVETRGGLTQVAFKGVQSTLGPQRHFSVEFEG